MTCKYNILIGSFRTIYLRQGELWPSCLCPDKLVGLQISNSTRLTGTARSTSNWTTLLLHSRLKHWASKFSWEEKGTGVIELFLTAGKQYGFMIRWHVRVILTCQNIHTNVKTQQVFAQRLLPSLSRTMLVKQFSKRWSIFLVQALLVIGFF